MMGDAAYPRFSGILLAAGEGRRFGADKRRLPLPSGDSLLVHGARRLRAVLDDVVVVLRPGDDDLGAALAAVGCRHCCNPEPAEGLGRSIGCGVRASADADGWLIVPADLPLLRPSTIRRVAECLRGADAVVPWCHGHRGHPVGFARCYRDRLAGLRGERGGRALLRDPDRRVVWLTLHDPGIYRDLDRPDDLALLDNALHTLAGPTAMSAGDG